MKLLFDQNISFRIVKLITDVFPFASQVRLLGLENADDIEIWEYAKLNNYAVVTFDTDFYDLSLIKDKLNFTDTIHVTDSSNFLIANEIYFHLKQHVLSCNN